MYVGACFEAKPFLCLRFFTLYVTKYMTKFYGLLCDVKRQTNLPCACVVPVSPVTINCQKFYDLRSQFGHNLVKLGQNLTKYDLGSFLG